VVGDLTRPSPIGGPSVSPSLNFPTLTRLIRYSNIAPQRLGKMNSANRNAVGGSTLPNFYEIIMLLCKNLLTVRSASIFLISFCETPLLNWENLEVIFWH